MLCHRCGAFGSGGSRHCYIGYVTCGRPAPCAAFARGRHRPSGQTRLITANQKLLTLLERRAADQRQLAEVYQQWISVVSQQAGVLMHALLLDALIVIGIILALVILERWAEHLLSNPKLDRRQVETLRSISRASLRVLCVVIILLTLIGMPTQLGTIIGIVGAGLTVALKDFIVAFFGWLMLMGRNGIRLGDWVEINGVSGEVTELGMFHTVMLETGNWSDAGHPTGRRVTFTNSFAIEGHYFNFSTSGQWLWDELQVVVPAGRDPYPIVDELGKRVTEATAESARQAEQEWQRAVPAQRAKTFSGAPGINVKPVAEASRSTCATSPVPTTVFWCERSSTRRPSISSGSAKPNRRRSQHPRRKPTRQSAVEPKPIFCDAIGGPNHASLDNAYLWRNATIRIFYPWF